VPSVPGDLLIAGSYDHGMQQAGFIDRRQPADIAKIAATSIADPDRCN
jgi:hypothetical protein